MLPKIIRVGIGLWKKGIENIGASYETIDVEDFIKRQDSSSDATKMNRLDMIVRLLAIENYYGKNDFGFDLYRKMQDKRKGDGYADGSVARFKKLIESWEKKDYDANSRILISRDMALIDGSHRLAMCIYYGQKTINCKVIRTDRKPEYGKEWFLRNGFLEEEVTCIEEKWKDVRRSFDIRK